MKIAETGIGAATYSLKKALEMPNTLVQLLQNSSGEQQQALESKSIIQQPIKDSSVAEKGNIIDIII